ncbi:unnamed protein product [Dracunculus medinensis]|uniref:C2H2-type domain-containing protein n=1 Tax=Dracunculus medinensis TaxID=318479 RepID=A0A158Q2L5_DRAME|nr:unnamed protein product [Dracunculus medinensis]
MSVEDFKYYLECLCSSFRSIKDEDSQVKSLRLLENAVHDLTSFLCRRKLENNASRTVTQEAEWLIQETYGEAWSEQNQNPAVVGNQFEDFLYNHAAANETEHDYLMTALFDCGVNSSSDFTSEELSSNEQAVDNTYHKGCSNISGSLFGACPMNKSLNSTKKTNNIHQSEKMECASLDVGAIIYQNFNKVGRPKTGINLTCATCGITFESRKQLYSVLCAFCGKGFKEVGAMKIHIRYVHEKSKNMVCTKCEKRFVTSSDLVRHMQICHMFFKLYPCTLCGKEFKTLANARHHRLENCECKL